MPTPQEQAEYEQYLRETGQHPEQQVAETADAKRSRVMADINRQIDNTDYGAAMNNALGMMAGGGLAKAIPAAGGILGSAAEGAALGAAQSPEGERGKGALMGGGLQGGLSGLAKLLGKTGDVGMQIAVGRKKYTPGTGTELANEGLWGTQGMMRGQTARGLERTGQEMGQVAETIPAIDARTIGQQMGEELTSPLTGGGKIAPSARDLGEVKQLSDFAEDVASRGTETGSQALARRRAAGASAYSQRTGNPLTDPLAKASKLEQQKYSQALKGGSPGAYSDLATREIEGGAMVPLDRRYAALKKAERALGEEPTLPRSLLGLASMTSKSVPGGSLATSLASQAAVKGGKLAEFLAPLARQAAVGGSRDSGPSAQELQEYEQYRIETGQK